MNRAQLRERVKMYVQGRDQYDSLINDLLNEVCDSLAMPFEFQALQDVEEVTYTASLGLFALVNEPYAITSVRDLTNNRRLTLQDPDWYDDQDSTILGLPRSYVHFGNSLALYPIPDIDADLRIRSKRLPTPMNDDTDEPDGFPRDWHPIIYKLAASDLHFLLKEDQAGMMRKNEALAAISARQEVRTIEARSSTGRIIIERPTYRRHGSRTKWR
jgi:hypothetical protein